MQEKQRETEDKEELLFFLLFPFVFKMPMAIEGNLFLFSFKHSKTFDVNLLCHFCLKRTKQGKTKQNIKQTNIA
jgi:hypothetical protein